MSMNGVNMDNLPEAELFDVDGTLCDVRGIRHYVTGPKRNFHSFHMASAFCPPNPAVVERAHEARAKGRAVIVVTAREGKYRLLTRRWLTGWEIPFDGLWTRATGDQRPDAVVKREILAKIRLQYRVVKAHDDNPAVGEVWESEGIETVIEPGWDEQFTIPPKEL